MKVVFVKELGVADRIAKAGTSIGVHVEFGLIVEIRSGKSMGIWGSDDRENEILGVCFGVISWDTPGSSRTQHSKGQSVGVG
jgi:hypothetical protein